MAGRFFINSSDFCVPVTVCATTEYETQAYNQSAGVDRACAALTVCSSTTQYARITATTTSNRCVITHRCRPRGVLESAAATAATAATAAALAFSSIRSPFSCRCITVCNTQGVRWSANVQHQPVRFAESHGDL